MERFYGLSRFAFALLVISMLIVGLVYGEGSAASESERDTLVVPLRIEVENNLLILDVGGSIELTVTTTGTRANEAIIHWTSFDQGTLSAMSGNKVTWTAPSGPGDYMIRATAIAPGETAYVEMMIVVK